VSSHGCMRKSNKQLRHLKVNVFSRSFTKDIKWNILKFASNVSPIRLMVSLEIIDSQPQPHGLLEDPFLDPSQHIRKTIHY